MHIPDGYLSPSTCATLYALAASGWYSALGRVRRMLASRTIPLISVFAAFSFVVMMFNIPLPGGTTGHAIGVTVAAIVLGPSGSILAVSIALGIQALFFGDGGITTLGANCFNMAIIGSVVADAVYRLTAGHSEVHSRRRVWAAAIAGYASINAAALLTAFEFGIQPTLFHDASGTPLYAPYPLHIAIPAMMIGHLTFAGLAEAVISAGLVSYLQRSDIGLLHGVRATTGVPALESASSPLRLWWVIGILMLCTPLGVLATGTAWGEWSAADFANPEKRAKIEASSGQHAAPSSVPARLQKLSAIWTAPFPGYAPRFVKSTTFGYALSAMFGVGLLIMAGLVLSRFTKKARASESPS
ncbi:MAG TPA: cobalt transporter CbiM [Candidatus Sulfotelmatobacter sp.]|nr:cobalt transporter CbiM [Candidatus Sulfotelmatobacter sp.]